MPTDEDLAARAEYSERQAQARAANQYAAERGDPPNSPCAKSPSLKFDGAQLTLAFAQGRTYTFPAVSGRPDGNGQFDYSQARQRLSGQGPLPEGKYWIRLDQMQENHWYRLFMTTAAWGNFRITIHPYQLTETYGRGGFFIHGGSTPGSAGCIDLTGNMDRFVNTLRDELGGLPNCVILLQVNFAGRS